MTASPLKQPNTRAMWAAQNLVNRYISENSIDVFIDTYVFLEVLVYLNRLATSFDYGVPENLSVWEIYLLQEKYWRYRFEFDNLFTKTGTYIYALDSAMMAFYIFYKVQEEDVRRKIIGPIMDHLEESEILQLYREAEMSIEDFFIGAREMIGEFEVF